MIGFLLVFILFYVIFFYPYKRDYKDSDKKRIHKIRTPLTIIQFATTWAKTGPSLLMMPSMNLEEEWPESSILQMLIIQAFPIITIQRTVLYMQKM